MDFFFFFYICVNDDDEGKWHSPLIPTSLNSHVDEAVHKAHCGPLSLCCMCIIPKVTELSYCICFQLQHKSVKSELYFELYQALYVGDVVL